MRFHKQDESKGRIRSTRREAAERIDAIMRERLVQSERAFANEIERRRLAQSGGGVGAAPGGS
jgi:hypothetical protein